MLSSRFIFVWLVLSVPMQDPLCFSAQSGQSLIQECRVTLSLPLSHLPGPELFLSFLSSCVYYITFIVNNHCNFPKVSNSILFGI